MLATEKFSMRVSREDRKRFAELKKVLRRRSESDAIRHLVYLALNAFQQVGDLERTPKKKTKTRIN